VLGDDGALDLGGGGDDAGGVFEAGDDLAPVVDGMVGLDGDFGLEARTVCWSSVSKPCITEMTMIITGDAQGDAEDGDDGDDGDEGALRLQVAKARKRLKGCGSWGELIRRLTQIDADFFLGENEALIIERTSFGISFF